MRTRTLSVLALGLLVLAVGACGGAVADDDGIAPLPSSGVTPQAGGAGASGGSALGAHVVDEVLVQWKPGITPATKSSVRAKVSGVHGETIQTEPMKAGGVGELEIVKLPSGLSVAAAAGALAGDPAVEFVEPNWVYQHTVMANDPYALDGSLWGMYGDSSAPANAFGSQASEAWSTPTGADCAQYATTTTSVVDEFGATTTTTTTTRIGDVYVGIIDEGLMIDHEDLQANIGRNSREIPGNLVDDDNNGYVDDVYGWDFDANDSSVFDGAGDDHGTHVSGTVAAVGGNGKGVVGVCSTGIKLLSAKFLGSRGGTTANAIKAVDYFTALKTRAVDPVNIVATNNSWGGGGFSQALSNAIERANAANVLFVAAAGNETNNNDVTASYPSSYANANIIRVAALTNTGALASYSNYGATKVDIGAPGSGIWSTIPKSVKGKVFASYASYNGTSMATPHVTGAAAFYAGRHPGSSAATIKAAILASAVPTPSLSGKCVTGGRLNVSGF